MIKMLLITIWKLSAQCVGIRIDSVTFGALSLCIEAFVKPYSNIIITEQTMLGGQKYLIPLNIKYVKH